MSRDGLFTRSAEVSQLPEMGVTLAVAGEVGLGLARSPACSGRAPDLTKVRRKA